MPESCARGADAVASPTRRSRCERSVSDFDRSHGLRKPRGVICHDAEHTAPFAATSARSTCWYSLPQDPCNRAGSRSVVVVARLACGMIRPAPQSPPSGSVRPKARVACVSMLRTVPCVLARWNGVHFLRGATRLHPLIGLRSKVPCYSELQFQNWIDR